jgi:hypothetical protein
MDRMTEQQTVQLINKIKSMNSIILNEMTYEQALNEIHNFHNTLTYIEALQMIDVAALEDRVFHHNGGQAYLKLHTDFDILIIIDYTTINVPSIQFMDGTEYFKQCNHYNWAQSQSLRNHGSLAEWYKFNNQELQGE